MNNLVEHKLIEVQNEYDLDLPKHLTISAGKAISGLQMLQHERLAKFIDANPKHFVYYPTHDVAVYTGPDAVIP